MKTKFTIVLGVLFLSFLGSAQLSKAQLDVYFEKDKFDINKVAQQELDNFISQYKDSGVIDIKIFGYCDADGSNTYNKYLAQHRVNSVTKILVQNNLKAINTANAVGELGLETDVESIMKGNRKVRIEISYPTTEIVKSLNQPLSFLAKELKPKPQKFCIDPTRDTVLVLKKGSIITISKNSFEQNGTPITKFDDCILLSIDEVLSKTDSYFQSLTTISDQRSIESAGMLNINASYKDAPAQFIKEKEMLVMLPTQKQVVGNYQMFDGERNAHSNEMNWLVNNNKELSNISMSDFFNCGRYGSRNGTNCKFFFCKIKRFFRPKKYDSSNKTYQPKNKKSLLNNPCGNAAELFKKYKVDNYEDLMYKMNESLMKKYNVNTLEALQVAMKKERNAQVAEKLTNGTASFEDLRYMVFNTNNLGWANCDAFSDVPALSKTQVAVAMSDMANVDVKLVFKNRSIILSPTHQGDKFYFDGMPKGEKATVVAVYMRKDTPYLFIKDIVISKDEVTAQFQPFTMEELKSKLKILDV